MANYCTEAEAAANAGQGGLTFAAWWFNFVDELIERHTGQGYKQAQRQMVYIGRNNSLIKLPSIADTILSVMEDGELLPSSEYELQPSGRYLERTSNTYNWINGSRGLWSGNFKYKVTYKEPALAAAPERYRFCAAECVALIALFANKRLEFGIATTASDAGSAGRVSSSASTSFPASLVDEIRGVIIKLLPRSTV